MEQLRAECTDRNHPCASEMREGTFMAALLSHQETETLKCPSGRNEKPNAVHTHSTSEAHSSRGMSRKDHRHRRSARLPVLRVLWGLEAGRGWVGGCPHLCLGGRRRWADSLQLRALHPGHGAPCVCAILQTELGRTCLKQDLLYRLTPSHGRPVTHANPLAQDLCREPWPGNNEDQGRTHSHGKHSHLGTGEQEAAGAWKEGPQSC